MNEGIVFPGATPLLVNWNCGLLAGPVPPIAGCAWQELQLFELKRGPKPLFPAGLPETDSTAWNRVCPSLKNERIPLGLFDVTDESAAPVPRLPL
jgi:hypothetical protein